jgi:hypothetical protein
MTPESVTLTGYDLPGMHIAAVCFIKVAVYHSVDQSDALVQEALDDFIN